MLQWLNNNFGDTPLEVFLTAIFLFSFFYLLTTNKLPIADYFSFRFNKTREWVAAILLLIVVYQGTIIDVKEEISRDVFGGVGYLIGAFLALFIFSILLTYLTRLFFVLFKWIHKTTQ